MRVLDVTVQCIKVASQGVRRVTGGFSYFTLKFDKDIVVKWAGLACAHNHD